MSASLAREFQPERPPPSGPARLLSLVAATIFPLDRVLAGMVAVGLGMEAICLYLGLPRGVLHESLIRLGLATPHDRLLRKPGARSWLVLDTMRLIAWRVTGVHPETIGQRLGRSPNAIRAKARRLGLQPPGRKMLRRVDPATLVDPLPGFGCHTPGFEPVNDTLGSAMSRCGTSSGPVPARSDWTAGRPRQADAAQSDAATTAIVCRPSPVAPVAPVAHAVSAAPAASVAPAKSTLAEAAARNGSVERPVAPRRAPGQRELQLFGVVPAAPTRPAGDAAVVARSSGQPVSRTSPSPRSSATLPALPLDLSKGFAPGEDLTWVGRSTRIAFTESLVRLVSLRAFGGEHWKITAKALGFTEPALRTLRTRIDLPIDLGRSRKSGAYDHERALFALAKSGWEMFKDIDNARWFWRLKGSGQRRCLYTQRQRGLIDKDDSRRFRPRISLAYPPCPA